VLVPVGFAALAFVLGPRGGRAAGMIGVLASSAAAVWLLVEVAAGGAVEQILGDWQPPLGLALRADGASAALLGLLAAVGVPTSIAAIGWFGERERRWSEADGFWPLWLLLWAGMACALLAGDLFTIYIALELITVGAVGLVILRGDRAALEAGLRYLLAALVGSLAFLLGVTLLYAAYGTLDIRLLADRVEPGTAAAVAAALLLAGLAIKAALFPLHFWLPPAHAGATPPVSAVLSALVVTVAFAVVLRLVVELLPPLLTDPAVQLVGGLGAVAILLGSVQAARQRSLKWLIAYSTVAQIGYLFVAVPLVAAGGAAAATAGSGVVLHAISHALAKAGMFLAAGAVLASAGHDRIHDLRGFADRLPMAALAIGAAGVTLMGLPPSGGFSAKFMMLNAALDLGQPWWAVVLIAGGPLAAAYVYVALRPAFAAVSHDEEETPSLPPRGLQACALVLALAALAIGVIGEPLVELIETGAGWGDPR
jgi:multicomponent Na+:H+ antiporter subunit D